MRVWALTSCGSAFLVTAYIAYRHDTSPQKTVKQRPPSTAESTEGLSYWDLAMDPDAVAFAPEMDTALSPSISSTLAARQPSISSSAQSSASQSSVKTSTAKSAQISRRQPWLDADLASPPPGVTGVTARRSPISTAPRPSSPGQATQASAVPLPPPPTPMNRADTPDDQSLARRTNATGAAIAPVVIDTPVNEGSGRSAPATINLSATRRLSSVLERAGGGTQKPETDAALKPAKRGPDNRPMPTGAETIDLSDVSISQPSEPLSPRVTGASPSVSRTLSPQFSANGATAAAAN